MKCPARETGKGVGGVWLGPQCLGNLKDPPSETVPKGNNLKHAVCGWVWHYGYDIATCLNFFFKLKSWTVASASQVRLGRTRNTKTNSVKTFRCS